MTIRPAEPDDLPVIQQIVRDAYSPYITRMGREPGPMLDDYAAHIAASHVYVLEAEPPGGIAGLVVLTKGPDHLFLDNIAVDPAQHGKGIGRRLLDFVEAEARRNGFDQIRLYTNALMTENLALYPRLGYRETERRIEKGYDRIYFTKFLA